MQKGGRLNFFVKLAILVFACFCVVTIVKLQFEYNDLQAQSEALRDDIRASEDRIEKIKNDLEAPFDDAYIVRIAREQLNYCLPEDIIFYSDR